MRKGKFFFLLRDVTKAPSISKLVEKSGFDEFLQKEFDVAQFGVFNAQRSQGRHVAALDAGENGSQMFQIGAHESQGTAEIADRLRF